MKIRIIENSRIPQLLSWFIKIKAITIYPFVFVKGKADIRLRIHEYIHLKQQRELFVVGFYVLYIWYWLKNIVWHKMDSRTAYREIPFEREAYENENNFVYALNRERFAWRNYKWS